MTTPLLAPLEAQPSADPDKAGQDAPTTNASPTEPPQTESLALPFRLGVVGLGAAVGLFLRLLAANSLLGFDSDSVVITAALTSAIMGLGLLLIAAERDRFGPSLIWISAITSLAWGALNWISPPFAAEVTVWSKPDQAILAVLGLGNGLLLAGIVALAFVRRHPTLTVGATMVASVCALAANTVLLRDEWPAIIAVGTAFAFLLLAWDQSPRRELAYPAPAASPRVSRAALSFISVALCGTAIQLWTSRTEIPRSIPAVIVCALLIVGAFVTLVGVRREIEKRETTLSEWTSWAREIRTSDFRAEMQNFESDTASTEHHGEPPRKLSFPNLSIPDDAPTESPELSADTSEASKSATTPESVADPDTTEDPAAPGLRLTADTSEASKSATTAESVADPDTTADPAAPGLRLTPDTSEASKSATTAESVADPDTTAASAAVGLRLIPDSVAPDDAGSDGSGSADAGSDDAVSDGSSSDDTVSIVLPTLDAIPAEPGTPTLARIDPAPADFDAPTETAAPSGAASSGAFSAILAGEATAAIGRVEVADLDALSRWLRSPVAAARVTPLLVAIEAMSLDEFESLPAIDAAMATEEIGSFLADTMPDADLVSWIDGPYFFVAHASKPDSELSELNRVVRKSLKGTDGVLAFLRPAVDANLDQMVDEAVMALLHARRAEERATGR